MGQLFDGGIMTEWQPIETAPKDGTRILLYGYECETQWNVCYWVTEEEQGYTGWYGWDWPAYEVPSHWMPLPEPPK